MLLEEGTPTPGGRLVDQKGMLFCPVCGHESLIDGDWVVHERVTSLVYCCPECENRITERE